MKKCFRNGKIFVAGKYHEDVIYDVSSNDLHVRFDGKGGITDYTLNNQSGSYVRQINLIAFVNGERFDAHCDKRVELAGRMQRIFLKRDKTQLEIYQFLAPGENAVFCEITASKPGDYEFALDLSQTAHGFHCAIDVKHRFVAENISIYLRTRRSVRFVLSYDTLHRCEMLLSRFSEYKKQVVDEFKSVKIPASAKTEKERALYLSGIFSALENYKEIGLFKGFCAGCTYTAPVRTYFRDSYWTVLSMFRIHPDLIRNQILTLAHGIEPSGDCPTSVTFEFRSRLNENFDGPSFFTIMVYDYINHTGDFSILDEMINGRTIYDACFLVVGKLSEYEDKTGLVVKAGKYSKGDWATAVNRTGYVTYVELLYARALFCLSRIAGTRDKARARRYRELFIRSKDAINAHLWNDEKGYYINYKDGDFVEDNLSVDTILAVLFGISDKRRTERLLDNVSRLLETRNNGVQKGGDYGVMSVFPFYRGIERCHDKSARDFEYHNGAAWPYWSALVAYAQLTNGRDGSYALTSSFNWNVRRGNYTSIECYSPIHPDGALLKAPGSTAAWVYDWRDDDFFRDNEAVWGKG